MTFAAAALRLYESGKTVILVGGGEGIKIFNFCVMRVTIKNAPIKVRRIPIDFFINKRGNQTPL